MKNFQFTHKTLHVENVSVQDITEQVGTPVYIYSTQQILENFRQFQQAFRDVPHLICYAVKANSNLSILHLLAKEGAGADIVSGGELYRALKAGVPPEKIVYSGVGKTEREIVEALRAGVSRLHIESFQEFEVIQEIARELNVNVHLSPRINPNIDAQTHPYISTGLKENKFGISVEDARIVFQRSREIPHVQISGISAHIGSQITKTSPFIDALKVLAAFIHEQRQEGFQIDSLDLGGGLGISYDQQKTPNPEEYGHVLMPLLKSLNCRIILEPGRAIIGDAGILVSKVLYTKQNAEKHFTIVDAAMTDCIRPALYSAHHEIIPVKQKDSQTSSGETTSSSVVTDIVGPVCESSDFLAKKRQLPRPERGDLLAILSAGAYGFVMASHYNSRPNVAEVLVKGDQFSIIRKRETYEDLVRGEEV